MVIPRSRSRSIESSIWGTWARASTAPVSSRILSASVDLPWSMWAMIEKLRMRSIAATKGRGRQLDPAQQSEDLLSLGHPQGEDRAEVGGAAREERRAQGDDLGDRASEIGRAHV